MIWLFPAGRRQRATTSCTLGRAQRDPQPVGRGWPEGLVFARPFNHEPKRRALKPSGRKSPVLPDLVEHQRRPVPSRQAVDHPAGMCGLDGRHRERRAHPTQPALDATRRDLLERRAPGLSGRYPSPDLGPDGLPLAVRVGRDDHPIRGRDRCLDALDASRRRFVPRPLVRQIECRRVDRRPRRHRRQVQEVSRRGLHLDVETTGPRVPLDVANLVGRFENDEVHESRPRPGPGVSARTARRFPKTPETREVAGAGPTWPTQTAADAGHRIHPWVGGETSPRTRCVLRHPPAPGAPPTSTCVGEFWDAQPQSPTRPKYRQ